MEEDGRRYTDQEFALILRMAAEGRASPGHGEAAHHDGMTLSEITQIAGEVGIDAALVRQAARRLADPEERSSWVVGGPTRLTRRGAVDGVMDPQSAAGVVDAVRAVVGQSGTVEKELGRLVWTTVGQPSQIRVSIDPRDDRTEVVVAADRGAAFPLVWGLSTVGGMVGAGIVGAIVEPTTVVGGVTLFAGMASGGLLVARTLWGRGTRKIRKKIDAVLREATRAIGASSS